MPKTVTKKEIENAVNNTTVAVDATIQRAIAGRLNEALSSDLNPLAQVKAVYSIIAKLERGELNYA
jgi:hypothetical protein